MALLLQNILKPAGSIVCLAPGPSDARLTGN